MFDVKPYYSLSDMLICIAETMNMEEWRVLPIAAKSMDKRKVTRRRAELQLQLGELFPPEGHVMMELSREQEEEVCFVKLMITGGAKHEEEATWMQAAQLHLLTFAIEENDVTLKSVNTAKVVGASLSPLTSAAGIVSKQTVYIFGGLDTSLMQPSNEMFVLNHITGITYDCTIFKDPDTCDVQLKNDQFMTGEVPSPRMGHSFTAIDDQYVILFGGMNFKGDSAFQRSFEPNATDGHFYKLDLNTMEWKRLETPSVLSRAYHQAVYLQDRRTILFTGGVTYTSTQSVNRIPLGEVLCLNVDTETISTVVFDGLSVCLSHHASCIHDGTIIVQGGYQQGTPTATRPKQEKSIYVLDLEAKVHKVTHPDVHFETATTGHTAMSVDSTCIIFIGGSTQSIFAYTSKKFTPDSCDLADDCSIEDSPEVSPISWIQCEGKCKKWLHQFCAKVEHIPKGKWMCKNCNTKLPKMPAKTARKRKC